MTAKGTAHHRGWAVLIKPKGESMKLASLKVQSMLGIDNLEIKFGEHETLITGENASGKSSIIEILKSGFKGGHDATLLRDGAEKGQAVLLLDDGVEIIKKVSANESDRKVTHPEIGPISKVDAYIKRISNALSLNPLQFITAEKKDRLNRFLEAIPITVTKDQLPFVGSAFLDMTDFGRHGLQVISGLRDMIYSSRTDVNRDEKLKRSTVTETRKTLPPPAPEGDWQDMYDGATATRDILSAATQARLKSLTSVASNKIEGEKLAHSQLKDHVSLDLQTTIGMKREAMEKEVGRIRAEFRDFVDKINIDNFNAIAKSEQARDGVIATVSKKLEEDKSAVIEAGRPQYEALTADIAKAENMIELHKASASAVAFVEKIEGEANECATKSNSYSEMIDKLDEFKFSLLKKLPFPGTEVRDGDIYINNIPFDRVNDAERVKFSINLAIMKAGQLKLICVDGMEKLDSKNFAKWEAAIAETGVQCVITRVTDGPRKIEAKG
jgi:hypothetical protein